jgi:hypothetical protein
VPRDARERVTGGAQDVQSRIDACGRRSGACGPWAEVSGATAAGGTLVGQLTSFSVMGAGAPTITVAPANPTVTEPAIASFSVTALGNPPFAYQWERWRIGGANFAAIDPAVKPSGAAQTYSTPATLYARSTTRRSVA